MPQKRFHSVWLSMAVVTAPFAAHADLLGDCNATASQINKSTPQQLDKVTTLMSTVCLKDGRDVLLIYRNEVSAPKGALDQQRLNAALKPKMLQAWCTDPVQRRTLNLINIRYTYNESDGRYIGRIDLSRNDCN